LHGDKFYVKMFFCRVEVKKAITISYGRRRVLEASLLVASGTLEEGVAGVSLPTVEVLLGITLKELGLLLAKQGDQTSF